MNDAKIVLSAEDKSAAAFDSVAKRLEALGHNAEKLKGLLEALGVAFTLAEFTEFIAHAIEGADALGKLAQRTGMSTETLSQMHYVAKLANISTDTFNESVKKLNISIAKGIAGDQEKVFYFKQLGIVTSDLGKGTEAVMMKMADAYAHAQNGAGKVTNATKLMAKTSDEMIPFLNAGSQSIRALMKEADELGLTISGEFAEKASEFTDNLTRLHAGSQKLAILLGGMFVESLNKAMKAFLDARKEGSAFEATLVGINTLLYGDDRHRANVEIVDTTNKIIEAMNALDKARYASRTASSAGEREAAAFEAKGWQDRIGRLKQEIATHQSYAKSLDDESSKQKAAADAANEAIEKGKSLAAFNAEAKAEYDKLIKSINEKLTADQKELELGRAMTEAEKFETKILSEMASAKVGLSAAAQQAIKDKLAEAKAIDEKVASMKREQQNAIFYHKEEEDRKQAEIDLDKQMTDEGLRVYAQLRDQKQALADVAEQMSAQYALMGATDRERTVALEQLQIEQQRRREILKITEDSLLADKEGAKAKVNEIAATATAQAAAKGALQEQIDLTNKLADTGKQLWDDLWSGGHGTLKKLGDDIKKFLLDELYQLVVKKWIINIAANMTGGGGVAGAAVNGATNSLFGSAANSLGSNFINAGSVGYQYLTGSMSGANAAGTIYANATGTGIDGLLATNGAYGTAAAGGGALAAGAADAFGVVGGTAGSSLGVATGLTGAADLAAGGAVVAEGAAAAGGAGLLGGASAALAAMGPVGWIALAALAIGALSGGGHGPKTELGTGGPGSPAVGDVATARQLAAGINATYGGAAGALGLSQTSLQDQGLFISKDPNGTAMTQLEVHSANYDRGGIYGTTENVGRSDADLTKALALSGLQDVFTELQVELGKEGLTGQLADLVSSVHPLTDSLESMQAVLQKVEDIGTFDKAIAALGPTFSNLTTLSVDMKEALIKDAGGLQNLTAQMIGYENDFFTEAQKHDALLANVTKAYAAANVVLPTTRDAFIAAVNAAEAAGNEHDLSILLATESAFKDLYPAIDDTAAAADAAAAAAASAIADIQAQMQKDYFASFAPTIQDGVQKTSDVVSGLFSGINDKWAQMFDGLKSEIDQIRGAWTTDTTGMSLQGSEASFQALVTQAAAGGKGAFAAAQQLPAAAQALLAIANAKATSWQELRTVEAMTAQALSDVQPSLKAQKNSVFESLSGGYSGATNFAALYGATGGNRGLGGGRDGADAASLRTEISNLRADQRVQMGAVVRINDRLTKVLEKWDADGMPGTR